mgnify:CR=1 FL=1
MSSGPSEIFGAVEAPPRPGQASVSADEIWSPLALSPSEKRRESPAQVPALFPNRTKVGGDLLLPKRMFEVANALPEPLPALGEPRRGANAYERCSATGMYALTLPPGSYSIVPTA